LSRDVSLADFPGSKSSWGAPLHGWCVRVRELGCLETLFISYRRQDTAREAHVLKAILEARLREVAVFIDTADIPSGVAWPDRLQRELARSSAVLVVIGPTGVAGRQSQIAWWSPATGCARRSKPRLPSPVRSYRSSSKRRSVAASIDCQTPSLACRACRPPCWIPPGGRPTSSASSAGLPKRLTPRPQSQVSASLASGGVDGWIIMTTVVPGETADGGPELYKVFEFSNVRRAFSFMELVARRADAINHHPDWRNVRTYR
jgi:pterin-4a-carbinolamine dehydratase